MPVNVIEANTFKVIKSIRIWQVLLPYWHLLTYELQDIIIASGQMVMDGIKTKSTGSKPFFSIKKLMQFSFSTWESVRKLLYGNFSIFERFLGHHLLCP